MLVPNYFYAPNTTERKSTGLKMASFAVMETPEMKSDARI